MGELNILGLVSLGPLRRSDAPVSVNLNQQIFSSGKKTFVHKVFFGPGNNRFRGGNTVLFFSHRSTLMNVSTFQPSNINRLALA